MSRRALCSLAVLLCGCTATFIGDRAYRAAPDEAAAPPEREARPRRPRDMEIVDAPAAGEYLVFHEPVEATKRRFHELSPRLRVVGARRPRIFANVPPVRLSLPTISSNGPSWPGGGDAWFSLTLTAKSSSLTVFPALTAEVMFGESRFYTSGPVPGADQRPVLSGKIRECDTDKAASSVRWNGFLTKTRSPQSLEYFEMRGLMSPKSCRAEASEVRSVKAVAVLPGVIYAARRCADESCQGPAPQSVVLLGPPARWMPSTTAQPNELLTPHSGSFSRAEVAMRRGGAGTALFTVDADHMALFRGQPNPSSFIGVDTIVISVDIIWPSTADEPTFSVQFAAPDSSATFADHAQRLLRDDPRPRIEYSFSKDPPAPARFPDPRAPTGKNRRR